MLVTLNEMKAYLGIGGITYPIVTVPLTIDTTVGTITRTSGNWNIDKVVVGSLITLAGFDDLENNVEVAVVSIDSPTVIKYFGPVDMVDGTGTTTSFDQADPPNDTSYDAFLTSQINIISEAIEGYCGRTFLPTDYVQTFYREEAVTKSKPLDTLQLYQFPIISITHIKEIEEDTAEEFLLPPTDYRVNTPTAWVTRRKYANFFSNADTVEVAYTSGFVVVPYTIQNAVYSLIQERYNKKLNGIDLNFGSDIQSISIPGTISVAYDYSLDNNQRKTAFGAILGNYVNTLDYFRSERSLVGDLRLNYVAEV